MAHSAAAILSHDQRQTFRAATRFEKLIHRCFINIEAEIFEFSARHRATRVHDNLIAADHGVASNKIIMNTDCPVARSEEHTSELQSQSNLVCRLLLEKKKNKQNVHRYSTIGRLWTPEM